MKEVTIKLTDKVIAWYKNTSIAFSGNVVRHIHEAIGKVLNTIEPGDLVFWKSEKEDGRYFTCTKVDDGFIYSINGSGYYPASCTKITDPEEIRVITKRLKGRIIK